jgi:hypothetical protein
VTPVRQVTETIRLGRRSRSGRQEPAEVDPPLEGVPPMTVRDLAGIGIAIVGTVALVAIASNCISEPADSRAHSCSAQLLIAGGVGLINLAHVVGLMLFTSIGYRGAVERFFSLFSAIGTPVAILVVIAIGALA